MIKPKMLFPLAAVALMAVMASCKGRYADATPNGETVEVAIEVAEYAPDTAVQTDVEIAETPADFTAPAGVDTNNAN